MNERIRELEPQCWEYNEFGLNFNYEKFAELIVWEAIGLCKVKVDALTSPYSPEYEKGIVEGYRRANESLRYYFGVEK